MKRKNYIFTALALYFTYFIHGIGVSILAQYKMEVAASWGTSDISLVLQVIAALGLGRLISLPIAGPFSDRFGRRITGMIGILLYVVYFIGIPYSNTMMVAYIVAILGGCANSFLDTSVIPSILEIFVGKGAVANMFTKFSMSIGQLLLPLGIALVASMSLSYTTLFYLAGILIGVDALLIWLLPFPEMNAEVKAEDNVERKITITPSSLALIAIGFTCTATFQLWLNCYQELATQYGVADPAKIQSLYALGTMCAVLFTAFVVLKKWRASQVLIAYPAICAVTLLLVYLIQTPWMITVAGFVIGYAGAGGVLQLATATANELFPTNKGKITSIVMIASSIANYVVLSLAGFITQGTGIHGPRNVVLFNLAITIIGVALATYVNKKLNEKKHFA
ncbi:MFS transporter [Peptoniphilus sp. KCTC 25270]|uniref:MFS transporter n=1 Tax=Peptoniphilus sp. KCTC 25270 TaxID=2897414 RepID=UPI001E31C848|nr:MFS transporter [Peptoniphilus sp. KCTC 25270]MCD1147688.1 MFS transporter [Peptoniphilus sp. KCTC 25270]